MPTYGYECNSCKNQFEVFQSIKDEPLTICEDCGGTLRKRIYPVGIAFKGSGFYVNDYGKPAPSADAGGTPAAKTDPEVKAEAKADAPKVDTAKADAPKAETKSEAAPV